jgi:uncharacterized protein YukJ
MVHHRTKPQGQSRKYSVLVGRIKDGQEDPEGAGKSPHYEIWVDAAGVNYRIAVNVRSVDGSDVVAYYDPTFTGAAKLDLAALAAAPGLKILETGPGGQGLDYLRDKLFPLNAMKDLPAEGSGVSLANMLDAQIERAKADAEAVVIAFGESFVDNGRDHTFSFSPERGVHDIHMMQGNSGSFAGDNGVNGDGALFIRFRGGETAALFIRFSVQSTDTDDRTGAPSGGSE